MYVSKNDYDADAYSDKVRPLVPSSHTTVPVVFYKGEFIGGYTEFNAHVASGGQASKPAVANEQPPPKRPKRDTAVSQTSKPDAEPAAKRPKRGTPKKSPAAKPPSAPKPTPSRKAPATTAGKSNASQATQRRRSARIKRKVEELDNMIAEVKRLMQGPY